jgi:hypothetical protein
MPLVKHSGKSYHEVNEILHTALNNSVINITSKFSICSGCDELTNAEFIDGDFSVASLLAIPPIAVRGLINLKFRKNISVRL